MPEISIQPDKHNRMVFGFSPLPGENMQEVHRAQGVVSSASSFLRTAQDPVVLSNKKEQALNYAEAKLGELFPAKVAKKLVDALMSGRTDTVLTFKGTDKDGYRVVKSNIGK